MLSPWSSNSGVGFDSAEQGEHVSRALHAGWCKGTGNTLRTAAGLLPLNVHLS